MWMAGRSVTIEMPEDLYDRLSQRAAAAQRSVAAEVVEALAAAAPTDEEIRPRAWRSSWRAWTRSMMTLSFSSFDNESRSERRGVSNRSTSKNSVVG
jgi:plasmid stability protein